MPTFEPDCTNISRWWNSGSEDWEGFQEVVKQALTEAYEAGKRDAVPELEALLIKVAGQTAVIEKLRVALSETLECGEDGDWQSARRVISESLAATGATE